MAKRLLWIDDEWTDFRELVGHLQKRGLEVVCAENVEEGIDKLKAEPFDALLLDMIVPSRSLSHPDDPEELKRLPINGWFPGLMVIDAVNAMKVTTQPKTVVLTIADDEGLSKKLNQLRKVDQVSAVLRKGRLKFSDVTNTVLNVLGMKDDNRAN